jgi:hypothetical protein
LVVCDCTGPGGSEVVGKDAFHILGCSEKISMQVRHQWVSGSCMVEAPTVVRWHVSPSNIFDGGPYKICSFEIIQKWNSPLHKASSSDVNFRPVASILESQGSSNNTVKAGAKLYFFHLYFFIY